MGTGRLQQSPHGLYREFLQGIDFAREGVIAPRNTPFETGELDDRPVHPGVEVSGSPAMTDNLGLPAKPRRVGKMHNHVI